MESPSVSFRLPPAVLGEIEDLRILAQQLSPAGDVTRSAVFLRVVRAGIRVVRADLAARLAAIPRELVEVE